MLSNDDLDIILKSNLNIEIVNKLKNDPELVNYIQKVSQLKLNTNTNVINVKTIKENIFNNNKQIETHVKENETEIDKRVQELNTEYFNNHRNANYLFNLSNDDLDNILKSDLPLDIVTVLKDKNSSHIVNGIRSINASKMVLDKDLPKGYFGNFNDTDDEKQNTLDKTGQKIKNGITCIPPETSKDKIKWIYHDVINTEIKCVNPNCQGCTYEDNVKLAIGDHKTNDVESQTETKINEKQDNSISTVPSIDLVRGYFGMNPITELGKKYSKNMQEKKDDKTNDAQTQTETNTPTTIETLLKNLTNMLASDNKKKFVFVYYNE